MIVWGLGRHGGGVSAARHLAARGEATAVVDAASATSLHESVAQIGGLGITYRVGCDTDAKQAAALADAADWGGVVVNPAIRVDHPLLVDLQRRGVPLTTELALTLDAIPDGTPVVAVTGSNGKSGLCARLAQCDGTAVGGNFERDLLDRPGSLLTEGLGGGVRRVVVEVSSFQASQLNAFELQPRRPDVAVLTSLAANHIDWHSSVEAYYAAKRSLLRRTAPDGTIVCFEDDAAALGLDAAVCEATLRLLNERDDRSREDAIVTALAELGILDAVPPPVTLPHRRAVVADTGGVRWVDDSASTTPAATMHTLRRLLQDDATPQPIVLIFGGRNKGLPASELDALCRAVAPQTAAVATIGETAAELARLVAIHGGKVRSCRTLAKAVKWSRKLLAGAALDGGTLLLSPGFASVDQFADYRERGHAFAALATAE